MPWVSKQQARWGHSKAGLKALGGPSAVKEWDDATPKGSLPDKAGKDLPRVHQPGVFSRVPQRMNKFKRISSGAM